jgi:hypothetical protein
MHIPIGILTRDPTVRAAEDSTHLRQRSHCDRRSYFYSVQLLTAQSAHVLRTSFVSHVSEIR